jgi:hypothetical protein
MRGTGNVLVDGDGMQLGIDMHVTGKGHVDRNGSTSHPHEASGSYGARDRWRVPATAPIVDICSKEIAAYLTALAALFLCCMLLPYGKTSA